MDGLLLASQTSKVVVHPLVMFAVIDHHLRRPEGTDAALGVLFGQRERGTITVTNCLPMYHELQQDEDGQSQLALGKHGSIAALADLNRKTNKLESVVGFYTTTASGELISAATTGMFVEVAKECPRPVNLVMDLSLRRRSDHIETAAFVLRGNRHLARHMAVFQRIPVSTASSAEERAALAVMLRAERSAAAGSAAAAGGAGADATGNTTAMGSEVQSIEQNIGRLDALLGVAETYVREVVSGQREPSTAAGRAISDAVASVPRIDPKRFQQLFNSSLQDHLMVSYLAGLTRAQVAIGERIRSKLPYKA